MKLPLTPVVFIVVTVLAVAGALGQAVDSGPTERKSSIDWILKWSDEFNGPTGSEPDWSKWVSESGGNGWGNRELQVSASSSKVHLGHYVPPFAMTFTASDGKRS